MEGNMQGSVSVMNKNEAEEGIKPDRRVASTL